MARAVHTKGTEFRSVTAAYFPGYVLGSLGRGPMKRVKYGVWVLG